MTDPADGKAVGRIRLAPVRRPCGALASRPARARARPRRRPAQQEGRLLSEPALRPHTLREGTVAPSYATREELLACRRQSRRRRSGSAAPTRRPCRALAPVARPARKLASAPAPVSGGS